MSDTMIICAVVVVIAFVIKDIVDRIEKHKTNRYRIKLKHELDVMMNNAENEEE